jgi:IclR family transcriptional regulator, acetate operon repressor
MPTRKTGSRQAEAVVKADDGQADADSSSGKQVIARAAAVLRALKSQQGGMTLGQIAKSAGLPRTTVHRIVGALEAQQMVLVGADGVRLGPAIASLAASAHTNIVVIARPAIEALGRRTRETVNLCIDRGEHSISVDQYVSDQELRVVSPIGTAFQSHLTAHGKALLAQRQNDEIKSLFAGKLPTRTPASIDKMAALLAEIDEVRRTGFAIDQQEHAEGVCGVGVFLNAGLNEHYAISLGVPAPRFEKTRDTLLASLLQCKSEIEGLMGHEPEARHRHAHIADGRG